MKYLIGSLALSSFVAYLMWGPLRWFLYSLIPDAVEWGWIVKLFLLLLIGYFGGIMLPIMIGAFGIWLWIQEK